MDITSSENPIDVQFLIFVLTNKTDNIRLLYIKSECVNIDHF